MDQADSPGNTEKRLARHEAAQTHAADLQQVVLARQLFWENVAREMLTQLSMLQATKPELFDGRIAVLTHAGERIPVGEVAPMFACSTIHATEWQRAANIAVECTVFRIKTPGGELYTLPVREIRGMHAMTPELIKQLEQQAMERMTEEDDPQRRPFGLAAFTSPFSHQDEAQPSLFDQPGGTDDGEEHPDTGVDHES